MNYKLLALDMDGTVLAPDSSITPRTVDAINEALASGFHVVFCTGRSVAEMGPYLGLFPKMRYIICNNGTRTVDLKTGEEISFFGIERSVCDRIMEESNGRDLMIQIGVGDTFLMQEGVLSRNAEFGMGKFIELHRKTATFVTNLIEYYRTHDFPICKINFYVTNPETREEIVTALQAKNLPVVYESGVAGNIEMVSDKSGKGVGLLELARYLDVPQEQVIAVGDNYNDETMLKAAGLAVAMGNAVPAIKALAHEITADNAHDGVAEVIERYLLRND